MFEQIAAYSGMLAAIWITLGVYIAAKYYPNYCHRTQFCSELGAKGSPTQRLSPRLNNYPLGVLFCFFGGFLWSLPDASIAIQITGGLICLHGIGTWVAGVFPMDKDPYTRAPSMSCQIHSWAGFFMLLSLLVAPLFIAFAAQAPWLPLWFRVTSIVAFLLTLFYLVKMAKAVQLKHNVGLYQRLSYWTGLVWLSILSLLVANSVTS